MFWFMFCIIRFRCAAFQTSDLNKLFVYRGYWLAVTEIVRLPLFCCSWTSTMRFKTTLQKLPKHILCFFLYSLMLTYNFCFRCGFGEAMFLPHDEVLIDGTGIWSVIRCHGFSLYVSLFSLLCCEWICTCGGYSYIAHSGEFINCLLHTCIHVCCQCASEQQCML